MFCKARPDSSRSRQRSPAAEHSQSAGQFGAEPVSSENEKTYTVRAQGRLQTPREFGQVVVRSKTRTAQVVR